MKAHKTVMGIYIGNEFPDYKGKEIEIRDDYSQGKNPCYEIRFSGEKHWHDNIGDEDIKFKI